MRAEHSETDGAAPPDAEQGTVGGSVGCDNDRQSGEHSQRTFILSHFTTRLDGLDKKTQGGRGDAALR